MQQPKLGAGPPSSVGQGSGILFSKKFGATEMDEIQKIRTGVHSKFE
jgi:hypothetical protein